LEMPRTDIGSLRKPSEECVAGLLK